MAGKPATRDEMAIIAHRYDTALSRAMCIALGIAMPKPRNPEVSWRRISKIFDGLDECFANLRRVLI